LELKYGAEHLLLPQVLEELRQGATVEQLQSLQVAIRTTPTLETLWQEHMLDTVTPDPDRLPKGSTN
jgi:hypothetical protein